ncbi:metallophosphoesterase family protein [Virgibacillus dakarensis]|uniref:metallophosphoesterase n=1 Tax=Virgibacillus dakarensis TaxID=1917889 RepID=UPI000B4550D9|nr:metallophosphoesterase [Virgibacillus dakarensis]
MSEEPLQWLEQTLEKHDDSTKPIFVYLHNPLPYSFTGTDIEYYQRGILQDKQLREILSQYPQVIFFSGHTHHELHIPGLFVKDGFYALAENTRDFNHEMNRLRIGRDFMSR